MAGLLPRGQPPDAGWATGRWRAGRLVPTAAWATWSVRAGWARC